MSPVLAFSRLPVLSGRVVPPAIFWQLANFNLGSSQPWR
ncbi:hypothetical protein PF003_g5878 [Phytophthora fragariae]|nr:hypothetical protein PF003_g5878 [Phytophthora fragariae]